MAAPVQAVIPSDASNPTTVTHLSTTIGAPTGVDHTHTYTIPKITKGGSNGSCTIVNGVPTAYTAPT